MDEFGVLVESIGFKAQGRSAPMAKSKPKPNNYHFNPSGNVSASSTMNDSSSLPVDELDGIFRSNLNINQSRQTPDFIGSDDVFGVSDQIAGNDLDSFWERSNMQKTNSNNSVSGDNTGSDVYEDLLGSKLNQSGGVDDLFGGFSGKEAKNETGFDDLIPGFGEASSVSKNDVPVNDGFSAFQSASVSHSDATWPFDDPLNKDSEKASVQSSIDDLDTFVMGGVHNGSKDDGLGTKVNKPSSNFAFNVFENANDLDTIFGGNAHGSKAKLSSMAQDPLFDSLFPEVKEPVKQTSSSSKSSSSAAAASSMKTSFSATNIVDDFTSVFGDVTTSSGEFIEIDGEPEERRKSRLNRHMRMNARMAEALAEKNQRDLQIQHEQEEKHRLGETLDGDIKRWASGKEGNLRALLSSLQLVLWSDSGWRPISLTDMITTDSVKKVYKKATLFVHPDKVQQKGATLEQRYIAEKVFDLLKEAWTKFGAEELR